MPIFHKSVLRGYWAIRQEHAEAEASRFSSNIQLGLEFEKGEEPEESKPYAISQNSEATVSRTAMSDMISDSDSSNRYVAVIPLMNVMFKNSNACGLVGTRTIAERIDIARNSPNCLGTVILSDTPGGHTDSIALLETAVELHRKSGKPIVVNVEQCCSAGLMSMCGATELHMSGKHSEIGSLGVMATLLDRSEALKKDGVKQHIVYSKLSPEKNAPVTDALKGDYERLQSEILDPFAQTAIESLKKRRPQVKEETVFQGKVFYADEAIKIGLADRMATLDESIARVVELSGVVKKAQKKKSKSAVKTNSHKMEQLTAGVLPYVLAALGTEQLSINSETGQFELKAGAAEKIQKAYTEKYNAALTLSGIAVAADGSFSATAEQLLLLNGMFAKAEQDKSTQELQAAQQQLEAMQDDPETPPTFTTPQGTEIQMPITGWNAVSEEKPWNKVAWMRWQAAQGLIKRHEAQAYELQLNSTLVTEQMNEELGSYHRMQNTSVVEFLWPNESADTLFPSFSTGQYDELPQPALFLGEFLQARNSAWAEKGGFEYQADKTKVKSYQMSYRFTEEDMFGFMHGWLAELAGKDHPFHESFVAYLSRKIASKVADEIRQHLFTGVYLTPKKGEAGKVQHAVQGLFAVLVQKYKENRMLPTPTGKGTYEHFDKDGNINKNHIYFKVQKVIESMPKNPRDSGTWNAYMSKDDLTAYRQFEQKVVFSHPNFRDIKEAYKRDNFTEHGVPNWPDGAIVIAQPGMIRQGYREKGSENKVYTQREKRDTIVFLDGAHLIEPIFTGYKFDSREKLIAANRSKQLIFTNLEFGALSPAVMESDTVKADATTHFAFETQENTKDVAFNTFEKAEPGQTLYLIGGSSTKPTKIAKSNSNFVGIDSDIILKEGVQCKFLVNKSKKFVLVGLSEVSGIGIVQFPKDETEPDVSQGLAFSVNPNNDAANKEIADLQNPAIGAEYTIYGATGKNTCVLKNNDRLNIGADIEMKTGTVVMLMYTDMDKFVKIN